jgi:hypothetical protein
MDDKEGEASRTFCVWKPTGWNFYYQMLREIYPIDKKH